MDRHVRVLTLVVVTFLAVALTTSCGSARHASAKQQLSLLVTCLRQRGARVEVWTRQNVPAYRRRTFTKDMSARVIVTANVPADEAGKRPQVGLAVLASSSDAARSIETEWKTYFEEPGVRRSGNLVMQPGQDTASPRADSAAHDCFARA